MTPSSVTHRYLPIVACWLATIGWAAAQSTPARLYGTGNGLPHLTVNSITQSPNGQIWVGTQRGIATYDCCKWSSVDVGEPFAPRAGSKMLQVARDEVGSIWVMSSQTPIAATRRVDESWQPLPTQADDGAQTSINAVAVSCRGGHVGALVGTGNGRLYRYDGRTPGPDGWRRIALEAHGIHAIARVGGYYYVGHTHGAARLPVDPFDDTIETIAGLPDAAVTAVAADGNNQRAWLFGHDWIASCGIKGATVHLDDPEFGARLIDPVTAALSDDRGGVHFGNFNVAGYYHPAEGTEFRPYRNGFTRVGVRALFRDREGFLWAGGVRGVAKMGDRTITNLSSQDGLADDEVTAIAELRDGRMVLGHGTSLTFLESPSRTVDLSRPGVSGRVMSLCETPSGRILVAATSLGLMSVDPKTGVVEQIALPEEPRAPIAQSVTIDHDGNTVVATQKRVARLRGTSVGPAIYATTSEGPFIRHVQSTDAGLLLSISSTGLVRVADGKTTTWRQAVPHANNVYCSLLQSDGTILVGSGDGVLQTAEDGRLLHATFGVETIRNPVYSIADSADGRIWFGTDNGLIVWNGSALQRITKETGIAGRESNRGASIRTRDGNMWFGFEEGVSTFHLDREHPPRHGPSVELLPRLVNGRIATTGELASDEDSLTFPFRSISMRDEERLLHQYRIEGRTDDWSPLEAMPQRRIDVVALPPGRYRMNVRVVDSNGMSDTATGPWFAVEVPVQRRWWFWFLAGAGLIAACSTLAALAVQRRNNRRLHQVVDERTRDLTSERNRLQTTLSSIADGIIGIDAAGRITLWNAMASKLTGHESSAIEGKRLADLLPGLVDEDARHASIETQIADGSLRCFDVSKTSIGGDPANGQVLAFRDVTDQREQDRLLRRTERLESLGVLAGGIAHDFNNLLAVMLGNLSLIDSTAPEENGEFLQRIHDAVVQSRDLTQQLLTFSKGGAPVRRPGSLADVLRESASLALSGANVRCEIAIADDLHPVEFDAGQLAQVVHNIVLNARQAMPDGGTVELHAYNSDRSIDGMAGAFVVIEIRDQGVGIPTELGERIFDPYFSTKPYGTGLGLATSHSIIKQHDGRLSVESSPNQGTTFRIDLPACTNQDKPRNEPRSPSNRGTISPRRVLCMDDEDAIRQMLRHMLGSLGHRVDTVENSERAVTAYREALVRTDRYDLVILDMTIPGGAGGKATLEKLRAIDPDVTAIAASGYSIEPVLGNFDRYGFRAALSKPFSRDDLAAAIAQAIGTASP